MVNNTRQFKKEKNAGNIDTRRRGAMGSTLVSGAKKPRSSPARCQQRKRELSTTRKKRTGKLCCINLALFFCKIGFLSSRFLSGNSIDFLSLLFPQGYRRKQGISALLPQNFILRSSRIWPNKYFHFLPLISRMLPEFSDGPYVGCRWET